jgi:hypothetical protein
LVPAVSPATIHFAIDQQAVPISQNRETVPPDNPASDAGAFKSLAEEMLLFAKTIRNLGATFRPTEVGTHITDVYRRDDQLFIRYVIDNGTTRPFAIGIPEDTKRLACVDKDFFTGTLSRLGERRVTRAYAAWPRSAPLRVRTINIPCRSSQPSMANSPGPPTSSARLAAKSANANSIPFGRNQPLLEHFISPPFVCIFTFRH